MRPPDSSDRFGRRDLLKSGVLAMLGLGLDGSVVTQSAAAGVGPGALPQEPLEIGDQPQFVLDLYAVDSTWALYEKRDPVKRVFHAPRKHASNPLLGGDLPSNPWVTRDGANGLFRMWYQVNLPIDYKNQPRQKGQPNFTTRIAYAESSNGVDWVKPDLDLFSKKVYETLPSNVLLNRPDAPAKSACSPQIVEAPQRDRRGHRYLMLYRAKGAGSALANGIRLIGSRDGIHWDETSDTLLSPIASDHHNTVVYDPRIEEYVMFLRAKHIYLAPGQKGGYETIEPGAAGERLNTGQSRRGVARMTSKELWTQWQGQPQQIIAPDELDAEAGYNFIYGMPVHRFAGIYWGCVQSFRMNDYLHTQLAWSRDGTRFERLPLRPKLLEYGPEGSWDDTMISACPQWIEAGDQWHVYYNGWDGPHETAQRSGGIGLATLRKEGLISLRGPAGGGVVCTRQIRWPGGSLRVNVDAHEGEMRVRVSDPLRKPLAGYDYDDCVKFTGDSVSHEVKWGGRSLQALKGQIIRLEFFLKDADLYTFRAAIR
jgi:hypothetical protein